MLVNSIFNINLKTKNSYNICDSKFYIENEIQSQIVLPEGRIKAMHKNKQRKD